MIQILALWPLILAVPLVVLVFVERYSRRLCIMMGLYTLCTLFLVLNILLALHSVWCLPDISRVKCQFCHFNSVHFTPPISELSLIRAVYEEDDEKLDVSSNPCIVFFLLSASLSPFTLLSAFDWLQVQP